jgi:hypothetical protein
MRRTIQHVRSSQCVIANTQPTAESCTPIHTCMPTYQIQTHDLHVSLPSFHPQHNSTYHAQTCRTTTYSYEQAMYCTHVSVWSVELRTSATAMCCAPSAPMELSSRLYAHVCVRSTIQRTCVAHDARSHTHNRVRDHIHLCMRACVPTYQIQTRMHALHVYLSSFQCKTQ